MNGRVKQGIKVLMQRAVFPLFYGLGKLRPIDPKLVLFADSHHSGMPFSMEDVYEAIDRERYRVISMIRDCDRGGYLGGLIFMLRFMLLYAQARCVFICDYFLPAASCKKREGTTLVQLWHGGGALKKIGYDTVRDRPPDKKFSPFRNYTLVTCSSEESCAVFSSGMGLTPGTAQPLGLSRTDRYYSEAYKRRCRAELLEKCPAAKEKKVALYAPTFRGSGGAPAGTELNFLTELRRELGEDWLVIVKLHPLLEKRADEAAVPIPTERLLPAADVLITDYSSILYDYLLLERPLVLYAPDLEQWRSELYSPYEELPGQIVTDSRELAEAVRQAEARFDKEKHRAFREKYMGACDGQAVGRLLRILRLEPPESGMRESL